MLDGRHWEIFNVVLFYAVGGLFLFAAYRNKARQQRQLPVQLHYLFALYTFLWGTSWLLHLCGFPKLDEAFKAAGAVGAVVNGVAWLRYILKDRHAA